MTRETKIEFIKGDITQVHVDAIVNAANTSLLGGGGVDGAIHRAAGPLLLEECKSLGGCKTGEAKMTKGYNLPARYVIHTAGPVWNNGNHHEPEVLADCYRNILLLAQAKGIKTLAFPSISTGAYRFPVELAAAIAIKTVKAFIHAHPDVFEKITFVLFSNRDLDIYQEAFQESLAGHL